MSNLPYGNRITVVDYGLGNLFSLERAIKYVGGNPEVSSTSRSIENAAGIILPGVGAFGDGMAKLQQRGLIEPIMQAARSGKPVLGICLGMQLLFDESEEFGQYAGLGLIEGKVVRLLDQHPEGARVKVPNIGWNELYIPEGSDTSISPALEDLTDGDATYFVHSYVPQPASEDVIKARINYGGHWYCAAVEKDNLTGVQFHPEKSGPVGLRMLKNLCDNLD